MHHLSVLAGLPAEEIPGAFQELKPCLLEEANEVTYRVENNGVHGRTRGK